MNNLHTGDRLRIVRGTHRNATGTLDATDGRMVRVQLDSNPADRFVTVSHRDVAPLGYEPPPAPSVWPGRLG